MTKMNKAEERKKFEENLSRHWKDKYSLVNILLEEISRCDKTLREGDQPLLEIYRNASSEQKDAIDRIFLTICNSSFAEIIGQQKTMFNMLWHDEKVRRNKKPTVCQSCGRGKEYVQKYGDRSGYFCLGCGADDIQNPPICGKCGDVSMKESVHIPPAIIERKPGETQCFGGTGVHSGEAPLEPCWKCPKCGYSQTILK